MYPAPIRGTGHELANNACRRGRHACRHRRRHGADTGRGRALHPAADLPHRAVRELGHPQRQRDARLPRDAERARRRRRRRQARDRGVRDRLQLPERGRVLRAHQGEGAARLQPGLDRHHAPADPEGLGRPYPGPVDGLRPLGGGGRADVPLDLQPARHLLGRALGDGHVHRREGGRPRQAAGQEDRLHLPRRRLRPRALAAPRPAGGEVRLHHHQVPGRPEADAGPVGAVAERAPRPAGLGADVGLGGDEPDRHQGGGEGPLPDGPLHRQLVGGGRRRRAAGRRGREGLPLARLHGRRHRLPGGPGHPQIRGRPRQEPGPPALGGRARTSTTAAWSAPPWWPRRSRPRSG